MSKTDFVVKGAGLGLRRDRIDEMIDYPMPQVNFMEIAPENWIGFGGRYAKKLRHFTERFDFVCHGLSLSIGGPTAIDVELVKNIKTLMQDHNIKIYSEHLTYCSDDGHLYDLLPIPFTTEAVHYVADRIKQVQDILEQQIAIENASYYAVAHKEMEEIDFLNAVIEEADCALLLDVNNIYVNSVNHGYDAINFLDNMPKHRIAYAHIAGHYNEADDLIVDTHGADVIDPVWKILNHAYKQFGTFPTLLERDFNIPPIATLLNEVEQIHRAQQKAVIEVSNG